VVFGEGAAHARVMLGWRAVAARWTSGACLSRPARNPRPIR